MKRVTPAKIAIVTSGISQRTIAAQVGLDESVLSRIVNGLHTDQATRESIASAIGRHVDEVFPPQTEQAA